VKNVLVSLPPYSKSPDTSKKYLSEIQAAVALPHTLLHTSPTLAEVEDEAPLRPLPRLLLISSTSVFGSPSGHKQEQHVVTELSAVAAPGSKEYTAAFR